MRSIDELRLEGRRCFVRVDFNVPVRDGSITDTTRIDAALATIDHARKAGARVILASHRGRPKGQPSVELSLGVVAPVLAEKLDAPVAVLPDCVGDIVQQHIAAMSDGDIALLENLRFHVGEEANDETFAKELAGLCDVFVNDAFGTAHRAHASTAGIVPYVDEAAAGFLLQREVTALGGLVDGAKRPFVAILGGAKVSDKIALIENLLHKIDVLVVGGAMAYTFLAARGDAVGTSRVETDRLELAKELIERMQSMGVTLLLPEDHVVAAEFSETAPATVTTGVEIPEGHMGLDIGPKTRKTYADAMTQAATILWNGPMGVFEWAEFAAGTMAVANAVADSAAHSVVGGGDSVAAITKSGRAADIGHISTGGGASLEFLEGKELPGIAALEKKERTS